MELGNRGEGKRAVGESETAETNFQKFALLFFFLLPCGSNSASSAQRAKKYLAVFFWNSIYLYL